MTTPKKRRRNWIITLVVAIIGIELLYLAAANTLLNTGLLPTLLNRRPEQVQVEWASGWTLIPGYVHVQGLNARGQTPKQRWQLSVEQVRGRLVLRKLLARTVELRRVEAKGVAAGLQRLAARSAPDEPTMLNPNPAPTSSRSSAVSLVAVANAAPENLETRASVADDAATEEEKPRWKITVADATIDGIEELALDDYRLRGTVRALLTNLDVQPRGGAVAIEHAEVELSSGELKTGTDAIARKLQVAGRVRLDPWIPDENPGVEVIRSISGTLDITGDITSYGFINRYLANLPWLELHGQGSLSGTVQIETGQVLEGSQLTIAATPLTVDLDEGRLLGLGAHHRVEGAGSVDVEVRPGTDAPEAALRVAL